MHKLKPGTSDAVVSQFDLFTSMASLVNSQLTGPDSKNMLSVLLGISKKGRKELILESNSKTALRKGNWILIPPYQGPAIINEVNIETGNSNKYQLYNLKNDLGQRHNLAGSHKKKLQKMINDFKKIRDN